MWRELKRIREIQANSLKVKLRDTEQKLSNLNELIRNEKINRDKTRKKWQELAALCSTMNQFGLEKHKASVGRLANEYSRTLERINRLETEWIDVMTHKQDLSVQLKISARNCEKLKFFEENEEC